MLFTGSRKRTQTACCCVFFQAEDGIRYLTVTGVQTCALPILDRALAVDCWRRLHDLRPVLPGRNLGNPDFAGQTMTSPQSQPKHPILRTKSVGKTFGDRKSTRLNSSHSQISYAVFCLKKKNKY